MKRLLGNIALASVVTLVCLAIAEVGLRVFTPFPIHGRKANKIYDIDAGYRLNPGHPNIDKHGFRNKPGPTPRVMAALGDSHTFGTNVKPGQTWPVQFEKMTGVPTYNFGVGSYAVYAHFANAHRALDQGYKYVIIALLIHNDFKVNGNSCDIDYVKSEFWQKTQSRLGLHLPDCSEADNWRTAHAPGFIRWLRGRVQFATLSAIDYLVLRPLSDKWYRLTEELKESKQQAMPVAAPKKTKDKTLVAAPDGTYRKRPASSYFAGRAIKNQEVEAAFTDLRRQAIVNGIDDFEVMLADLKRAADEKGAKVALMFIPSKVQLFYEYLDDLDIYETLPILKEMAVNHQKIERRLMDYMDSKGLLWSTAKPELIAAIEEYEPKGGWVFPPTGGHPNPVGYTAYAKSAVKLYERMKAD